jgi:Transketolase, N-terminal subunit
MILEQKAVDLRLDTLELVTSAGTGHIGGDFSEIEILTYLYYEGMRISPALADDPERDRFVLSKGHSVEAYYCILADRGFFEKKELFDTYSRYGSRFIGHPNNELPGVEMNSGSLGHGLSAAVGMALAGKMEKRSYYVYTLTGDGELAEGSVWEAFMSAPHYKLDHLIAFIDRNGLQISGSTEDVMPQGRLREKLQLFGWDVYEINGNSIDEIRAAVQLAKAVKGKPSVIIADTVKGWGVSFMENKAGWHHRVPTAEEKAQARAELLERRRILNECGK